MKKEDLKKAYSKPPQSFHYSMVRTLNSLDEKEKVRPKSRVLRTAAVCALVLAIGVVGAVSASAVFSSMAAKKESNYGIEFELTPSADAGGAESASQPQSDKLSFQVGDDSVDIPEYVKLNIGYLPEGVIPYIADMKYGYNGSWDEKSFTFVSERVSGKQTFTDIMIEDYEQFDVNGNPAVLAHTTVEEYDFETGRPQFSKRFYIYFENKGLFVMCYVTSDVSDDEIKKVMENLTVVDGTEDDNSGGPFSNATTAQDRARAAAEEDEQAEYDAWLAENSTYDINVIDLGTQVSYDEELLEGDEAFYGNFSVDSIEVLDNISGLDENCFEISNPYSGRSLSDYADENGNILPYTRRVICYGDRLNTKDEVVSSQTANRRLVYITLTVNNTNDKDGGFYIPVVQMERLFESGGELTMNVPDDEVVTDVMWGDIDYIDNNNVASDGFQHGYYCLTVPANSSETIHIGFWADEDLLDTIYVKLDGSWYSNSLFDPDTNKFVVNENYETDHSCAYIKVLQGGAYE